MSTAFQWIVSPQNDRLKQAVKLRQRRARDRQRRMLIDGRREISLARSAGVQLDEVFVDEHWLDDRQLVTWLSGCVEGGVRVLVLPTGLMRRVGYGDRCDQCVATAHLPRRSLAELTLPSDPLVAVLEALEKPGNVGAVVRSADAAGIDAVIVADGRTDLFNPNVIRASRGTVFTQPVCAAPADEVVRWLAIMGLRIVVTRVDATVLYDQIDYRRGTAIVFGSEAMGVAPRWHDSEFTAIRLPMAGQADSLNVAATAAVLFYEARRQRRT